MKRPPDRTRHAPQAKTIARRQAAASARSQAAACQECGYPHGYGDIEVPPGFVRYRSMHRWHLAPAGDSPA